jgi:hypothetical protein
MNGKSKPGRPRLADPRTHRYNFKLNEEENIRFCRMLAEAGLEHNRSWFIVKRIFAEEFRVVRIDPTLGATVSIVSRADTLRGTTVKEDFYRIMAVYRCDRIFRDSVDLEVTYVGYKPFKKRYGNTGFRGRIEDFIW